MSATRLEFSLQAVSEFSLQAVAADTLKARTLNV
jgi:hypothetical protein